MGISLIAWLFVTYYLIGLILAIRMAVTVYSEDDSIGWVDHLWAIAIITIVWPIFLWALWTDESD